MKSLLNKWLILAILLVMPMSDTLAKSKKDNQAEDKKIVEVSVAPTVEKEKKVTETKPEKKHSTAKKSTSQKNAKATVNKASANANETNLAVKDTSSVDEKLKLIEELTKQVAAATAETEVKVEEKSADTANNLDDLSINKEVIEEEVHQINDNDVNLVLSDNENSKSPMDLIIANTNTPAKDDVLSEKLETKLPIEKAVAATLSLIFILTGFVVFQAKKKGYLFKKLVNGKQLNIIQSTSIGPKKSIMIINWKGRELLVGVSESNMSVLDSSESNSSIETPKQVVIKNDVPATAPTNDVAENVFEKMVLKKIDDENFKKTTFKSTPEENISNTESQISKRIMDKIGAMNGIKNEVKKSNSQQTVNFKKWEHLKSKLNKDAETDSLVVEYDNADGFTFGANK